MRRTCIAIAVFLCTFAGCKTVQTPATAQIDTVLTDGTIDRIPASDRGRIKTILARAKGDIIEATAQRDTARKDAKDSEAWAHRGKIGAGVIAVGGVIFMIMLFRRLLR